MVVAAVASAVVVVVVVVAVVVAVAAVEAYDHQDKAFPLRLPCGVRVPQRLCVSVVACLVESEDMEG